MISKSHHDVVIGNKKYSNYLLLYLFYHFFRIPDLYFIIKNVNSVNLELIEGHKSYSGIWLHMITSTSRDSFNRKLLLLYYNLIQPEKMASLSLLNEAENAIRSMVDRAQLLFYDMRCMHIIWDLNEQNCFAFHFIVSCDRLPISNHYHDTNNELVPCNYDIIPLQGVLECDVVQDFYYIGTASLFVEPSEILQTNARLNHYHCGVNTQSNDLTPECWHRLIDFCTKIHVEQIDIEHIKQHPISVLRHDRLKWHQYDIGALHNRHLQQQQANPVLHILQDKTIDLMQRVDILQQWISQQSELTSIYGLPIKSLTFKKCRGDLFIQNSSPFQNLLCHSQLYHFYDFDVQFVKTPNLIDVWSFAREGKWCYDSQSDTSKRIAIAHLELHFIYEFALLNDIHIALVDLFPLLPIEQAYQYLMEQVRHEVCDHKKILITTDLYVNQNEICGLNQIVDYFYGHAAGKSPCSPHNVWLNQSLRTIKDNRQYNNVWLLPVHWNPQSYEKMRPLAHWLYWILEHMMNDTKNGYSTLAHKQEMIVLKKFIKWVGRNNNIIFPPTTQHISMFDEILEVWKPIVQELRSKYHK